MERGDGCTAVSRDLAVIIMFIVPGCIVLTILEDKVPNSPLGLVGYSLYLPMGGGASPQGVGSLAFSGFRYTKGRDFTS